MARKKQKKVKESDYGIPFRFVQPDTVETRFDQETGTVDICYRWEEIKTEDAEFEVIETKQLPSPKNEQS